MLRSKRNPGEGIDKRNIYEVWGDVVEGAADAHQAVIAFIRKYLEDSYLWEYFNGQTVRSRDDHEFLTLEWEDMVVDVDALPFGEHLDVYAILALRRGLLDHPDPIVRIANLEGWQRRNLQVFQTILKRAMEEALEALDEGRLTEAIPTLEP